MQELCGLSQSEEYTLRSYDVSTSLSIALSTRNSSLYCIGQIPAERIGGIFHPPRQVVFQQQGAKSIDDSVSYSISDKSFYITSNIKAQLFDTFKDTDQSIIVTTDDFSIAPPYEKYHLIGYSPNTNGSSPFSILYLFLCAKPLDSTNVYTSRTDMSNQSSILHLASLSTTLPTALPTALPTGFPTGFPTVLATPVTIVENCNGAAARIATSSPISHAVSEIATSSVSKESHTTTFRSSNNDRSVESDANVSETGSVRSYTGSQESTTQINLKRKLQESKDRINKLSEETKQLKHENRDLSFNAPNYQLIDAIDSSVTSTCKYSTLKFPGQSTEQAFEFAATWVEQYGDTFATVTSQTLESGKLKYAWKIKEETKFKKVTVRKCVDFIKERTTRDIHKDFEATTLSVLG